jgi:hypothetical protein
MEDYPWIIPAALTSSSVLVVMIIMTMTVTITIKLISENI